MGYEVHIVRRKDWEDVEEDSDITLEEWLEYVKTDNELKLTNGYHHYIENIVNTWQDRPGFCLWTAHKEIGEDRKPPWFDYGYGSISAKYPNIDTIRKMVDIAIALNARVQGDDCEFYDYASLDVLAEQSVSKKADMQSTRKWWEFWKF